LQIIGQICAFDGWYLSTIQSFGVNPNTPDYEIWHHEIREIALSYSEKCISISWTV